MTEYTQRQTAAMEQQTKLLARISKSLDRIGDALAVIAEAVVEDPEDPDDNDPAEAEVVHIADIPNSVDVGAWMGQLRRGAGGAS